MSTTFPSATAAALTLRQLADRLGSRHDYAYRLVGRLSATKIDGQWFFPVEEVEKYLSVRRQRVKKV